MAVSPPSSVIIIGAGVIGLSCAWTLAERGAKVSLYDKGVPGQGASRAAAGMLAPAYEGACEDGAHPDLFKLCLSGAERWPDFASRLEAASGQTIGYQPGPSIAVAPDEASASTLEHMSKVLDQAGAPWEQIDPESVRDYEPAITGTLKAARLLPTDGHVDNRAMCQALVQACTNAGVEMISGREIQLSDTLSADATLWTTGASPQLRGVKPVKGAALALRPDPSLPQRAVRCGSLYFTPHKDRVIIGATVEPGLTDTQPDPSAIDDLKTRAHALCAGVGESEIIEAWAGIRPGTADHAPMLGELSSGDWIAAGHYRNGILLAPLTGEIMADMILDGRTKQDLSVFSPARFSATA